MWLYEHKPDRRPPADDAPDGAQDLYRDLAIEIGGDVRFDQLARLIYSTDASSYQIEPVGVVRPLDADDVAAVVGICALHGTPVVPRAGGSSLAGQAVGKGIVIDVSRYMHRCEVDPESRIARVDAGVVLDRLNRAAGEFGLVFGPDPASSDRACMGGIVGNNAAGAHSIVHGNTADHVLASDVVLADGSRARLEPLSHEVLSGRVGTDSRESVALASLQRIVDSESELVRSRFPSFRRRSGGYNLNHLVDRAADYGVIDPGALLVGSEGTLAVATGIEVALVERPPQVGLLLAHFEQPLEPYRAVPYLLETGATAIELIDRALIDLARDAPGYGPDLKIVDGDPAALLIVEYAGESPAAVSSGIDRAVAALVSAGFRGPVVRATTAGEQARIWRVRKAGLGLLMRMRGDWKPAPGIEDTAVPPEVLADYMADVAQLLADADVEGVFYAHAGAGCIHVRPVLNLKTASGVTTLAELSKATGHLAVRYGGVQSSEHGDGLARGALNRQLFGDDIYALFEEVKTAFDPDGLLNPGKIIDSPAPGTSLRYGTDYTSEAPGARFAYPLDGSFAGAVEQCNGAGVCRKLDVNTMCPPYMVTLDETQSTRGRANALRAALDGRLTLDALAGDDLWEVMELCVSCKACKTECPSGVDMARLKTEVAAWRNDARGIRLRSRLFAELSRIDDLVQPISGLANLILSSSLSQVGARLLGIAPSRRLPTLADETFVRWWQRGYGAGSGRILSDPDHEGATVALFADTITNYHEPNIGRSAVAVLEAAGHRVVVPPHRCCGRPALSQGLIDVATRDMRANVSILSPFAQLGLPIVVPEPSCASALREDMPDLLIGAAEKEAAQLVAASIMTLDEFVATFPKGTLPTRPGPDTAVLHVHCHQRSAAGTGPSLAALGHIPGLTVTEPDAGCCGMAGSFGYEVEHLALSLAMAERRLAPAVREAPAESVIVAPGASCRQQIAHTTGRDALHPVELIAACLVDQPGFPRP